MAQCVHKFILFTFLTLLISLWWDTNRFWKHTRIKIQLIFRHLHLVVKFWTKRLTDLWWDMWEATELRDFIFSRSREPDDKSKAPESVSETFTREDSPRSLDSWKKTKIIILFVCFIGRLFWNQGKWVSCESGILPHFLRLELVTPPFEFELRAPSVPESKKHSYLPGQYNLNTMIKVHLVLAC